MVVGNKPKVSISKWHSKYENGIAYHILYVVYTSYNQWHLMTPFDTQSFDFIVHTLGLTNVKVKQGE